MDRKLIAYNQYLHDQRLEEEEKQRRRAEDERKRAEAENAGRRRRGGLKRNPKVGVVSQAAKSN
jgi:hypothetical protein